MDGDADHEDGGDAEPSLAAPENPASSQLVYMRGDRDGEVDAPKTVLPEIAADQPEAIILPRCGRGNVIAAVGVALLDMVGA